MYSCPPPTRGLTDVVRLRMTTVAVLNLAVRSDWRVALEVALAAEEHVN